MHFWSNSELPVNTSDSNLPGIKQKKVEVEFFAFSCSQGRVVGGGCFFVYKLKEYKINTFKKDAYKNL